MVQSRDVVTSEMRKQFKDPEEDILFQENITKISSWGFSQQRVLCVTIDHVYVFTGNDLSRKHRITNLGAIIQSNISSEIVLHFPRMKDLRITGLSKARQQELIHICQLRFINQKPDTTLEIYGVNSKTLKDYARDNAKYGFSNLPAIEFRLREKEIKGTKDDYEAKKKQLEREEAKVIADAKHSEQSPQPVDMDFEETRFSMKATLESQDSMTQSDMSSSMSQA